MSVPSENIDYSHTANVTRMHAAAAREKSDPTAHAGPISLGIIAAIAGIAILAGNYFGGNTGNDHSAANIKGYNYPLKFDGVEGGGAAPPSPRDLHQPEMWIAAGKSVYSNSCSSCHQPEGGGIPGQYPHLKGSEFVVGGEERLAAILLHGVTGPLTVDGKAFNGQMQPLASNGTLTDTTTAQVLSYIRNSWGNTGSVIYEDQIKAARKELGTRPSYTGEELHALDKNKPLPKSTWPDELSKGATAAPAPAPGGAAAPAPAPAPAPPAK